MTAVTLPGKELGFSRETKVDIATIGGSGIYRQTTGVRPLLRATGGEQHLF